MVKLCQIWNIGVAILPILPDWKYNCNLQQREKYCNHFSGLGGCNISKPHVTLSSAAACGKTRPKTRLQLTSANRKIFKRGKNNSIDKRNLFARRVV